MKKFIFVLKEGTSEGLFDKYPALPPPDIQNSTTPPYAPGDPIEAVVVNASNRAEDISLVRNQGIGVYDDMEPAPDNVPSVDTPSDDTLFEGHTLGWGGIDIHAVVAQNHNEPSFKNVWSPTKDFETRGLHSSYLPMFLQVLKIFG